jgi:Fe-S cluster assembly scaffold protein SufB
VTAMVDDRQLIRQLSKISEIESDIVNNPNIAHLFIHHHKVIGSHLIPGLKVDVKEMPDGIKVSMLVKKGSIIEKPVHLCFGMFPEKGIQKIIMRVNIEQDASISVLAHCTFPNALDVQHIMDAEISVGQNAHYSYFERHIHGEMGGVKVYPNAVVNLEEGAQFKTEFELLKGRVGLLDINYETNCKKRSILEMSARINGKGDDIITIRETGNLLGEYSRGVLTSRVAVRDNAKAEVYNKIKASAAYARGHVDCKEIIQDNGVAKATPIVEVSNPKAHVTHEASIGSVDSKQLQTLMSRGLSEEEAVELIIQGLLS